MKLLVVTLGHSHVDADPEQWEEDSKAHEEWAIKEMRNSS